MAFPSFINLQDLIFLTQNILNMFNWASWDKPPTYFANEFPLFTWYNKLLNYGLPHSEKKIIILSSKRWIEESYYLKSDAAVGGFF